MAAVRRSGDALVSWPAARLVGGILVREGAPSACPGPVSRLAGAGGCRGAGGLACWVPWGAGRCGMGVGCGARSAPLGGRAGGGPGEPGKPGFGGFPGFPRRFAVSWSGRCGAVLVACAVRFPGHWRGALRLSGGGRNGGVWGKTWNRAVVFRGRGGSGFSPSAFPDWSSLLPVYSWSRACSVPDLALLLYEGVRSGRRRRRGASASAQAGGGTETETQRTAPAHAGAVLVRRVYLFCAAGVRSRQILRMPPSAASYRSKLRSPTRFTRSVNASSISTGKDGSAT